MPTPFSPTTTTAHRYSLIYVRATPPSPSIEIDLGAPDVIEVETTEKEVSLQSKNIGGGPATFELYAKLLRTQGTYKHAIIFESGGGADGIAAYMDYKQRVIFSLCMDGNVRSTLLTLPFLYFGDAHQPS